MNTHYSLLGLEATAAPEEVKRAFRREVARYHPDKVQHLGPEFQDIATARAAALTEAYRTLMDGELRRRYDQELAEGLAQRGPSVPRPDRPAAPVTAPGPAAEPSPGERTDRQPSLNGAGAAALVTKAILAKVKGAADTLNGTPLDAPGFDAVYQVKGRRGLFRSAEPTVRVALKVVPQVDAAAVQAVWPAAVRMPLQGDTLCLLVLGSGLAPARELAGSISDLRRRTRGAAPLVIPVDIRDWQALLPPETPPAVRALLDRVRQGE